MRANLAIIEKRDSFAIDDEVMIVGRRGVWVIVEMVQPGDGIDTERPFWLRADGKWTDWVRASSEELTLVE